jgi:Rod binding domain-containing protein
MLDDTLMDQASKRGMGISDMMYKQLSSKMDRTYRLDGAEPVED